jgi:pantoate--beta-alanine ligase
MGESAAPRAKFTALRDFPWIGAPITTQERCPHPALTPTLTHLDEAPLARHPLPVQVAKTHSQLNTLLRRPCVLVPTMGALHEGHGALIRQGAALATAKGLAGGCVVTIFVNPTQFNDPADFARYPRVLEDDLRLCEAAGAACVFAPSVEEVYPPGDPPPVPRLPDVATKPGLEDAHRAGHFSGVCQVVARLFDLVRPAAAIFGEKDWQQLQVIRAMTAQLKLPIDIIPAPTIREEGGLAMSSRNRFLSQEDRRKGLALNRALIKANTAKSPDDAEALMRQVLAEQSITPDYAVVREASTLTRPAAGAGAWRSLIAAKVGSVRLIDNAEWKPER